MMQFWKRGLVMAALSAAAASGQALSVEPTDDAQTLSSALLAPGSGLTVVPGSQSVVGLSTQSGTYTGFGYAGLGSAAHPPLSIGDGIVLTTGVAQVGSVNTDEWPGFDTWTGTGSNESVQALVGLKSDQNTLSFEFTADAGLSSVSLSFILASEEFRATSLYEPGNQGTDGFGFFVDGHNYARFSPPHSPLFEITSIRDEWVAHNDTQVYPTSWNGLTQVFTVTALLDPSRSTHTLELVVYDGSGDMSYDTAVYLSGLSGGTAAAGGVVLSPIPEPGTWALALAGLALLAGRFKGRRGRSA